MMHWLSLRESRGFRAAVEQTRHTYDSQGQILALAFREKTFKLFPLRSAAVWVYVLGRGVVERIMMRRAGLLARLGLRVWG